MREDWPLKAVRWIGTNHRAVAVLLGIVWTGVMFLFLHSVFVSALCGAAFAVVVAKTLRIPPAS